MSEQALELRVDHEEPAEDSLVAEITAPAHPPIPVRGRALDVPGDLLGAIAAHCEACAPEEAVGALLLRNGAWRHRPLPNSYNAQRVKEPAGWPRSNRTAFLIAPADWIALEDEAASTGARIAVLYHSHVDAPPALSAEDRHRLQPGGEPLVPGLLSLVVEVRKGHAVGGQVTAL